VLDGDFSAEFKDFVAKCLVKDPAQRLSATQLLSHPFLATGTHMHEDWMDFIALVVQRLQNKDNDKERDADRKHDKEQENTHQRSAQSPKKSTCYHSPVPLLLFCDDLACCCVVAALNLGGRPPSHSLSRGNSFRMDKAKEKEKDHLDHCESQDSQNSSYSNQSGWNFNTQHSSQYNSDRGDRGGHCGGDESRSDSRSRSYINSGSGSDNDDDRSLSRSYSDSYSRSRSQSPVCSPSESRDTTSQPGGKRRSGQDVPAIVLQNRKARTHSDSSFGNALADSDHTVDKIGPGNNICGSNSSSSNNKVVEQVNEYDVTPPKSLFRSNSFSLANNMVFSPSIAVESVKREKGRSKEKEKEKEEHVLKYTHSHHGEGEKLHNADKSTKRVCDEQELLEKDRKIAQFQLIIQQLQQEVSNLTAERHLWKSLCAPLVETLFLSHSLSLLNLTTDSSSSNPILPDPTAIAQILKMAPGLWRTNETASPCGEEALAAATSSALAAKTHSRGTTQTTLGTAHSSGGQLSRADSGDVFIQLRNGQSRASSQHSLSSHPSQSHSMQLSCSSSTSKVDVEEESSFLGLSFSDDLDSSKRGIAGIDMHKPKVVVDAKSTPRSNKSKKDVTTSKDKDKDTAAAVVATTAPLRPSLKQHAPSSNEVSSMETAIAKAYAAEVAVPDRRLENEFTKRRVFELLGWLEERRESSSEGKQKDSDETVTVDNLESNWHSVLALLLHERLTMTPFQALTQSALSNHPLSTVRPSLSSSSISEQILSPTLVVFVDRVRQRKGEAVAQRVQEIVQSVSMGFRALDSLSVILSAHSTSEFGPDDDNPDMDMSLELLSLISSAVVEEVAADGGDMEELLL
jgi:hypothetical protein